MSAPPTIDSATRGEEVAEGSSPQPVVPGCVEFKYYHVPDGFKRLRTKRKVAIVFGYIGERYCGLQWNHLPDYPTVEEALMKALFETDMISLTNFSQSKVQQLLNFERASRTDRGVHALRNLVSVAIMLPYERNYVASHQENMLRLQSQKEALRAAQANTAATDDKAKEEQQQPPQAQRRESASTAAGTAPTQESFGIPPAEFSCEDAKTLLNKALPDDMHVYCVAPVTRSFNAYMCCGGRRYEYYIPTFAFMPRDDYVSNYFPTSLAPSMPSLQETGFVPRSSRPQLFKGPSQCGGGGGGGAVVDDAQPVNNKKKKKQQQQQHNRNAEKEGDSEDGPISFRKSRGHFPKTKKRRLEEKAKREAAEAAAEAAAAAAEEEALAREQLPADDAKESVSGSTMPASAPCDEETRDTVQGDLHVATGGGNREENNDSDSDDDEDEDEDNDDEEEVEELDENGNPKPVDWSKHFATHFNDNIFETMMTFRAIPEDAMSHAASYRIPSAQLETVREAFHQYEGTHCFHNFTPGGSSRDASCYRFIPAITVSEPMVWSPSDPLVQSSIDAWAPSRFFTADERVAEGFSARILAMEKDKNGDKENAGDAPQGSASHAQQHLLNPDSLADPDVVDHLRQEMRAHMTRVYGNGLEVVRVELQGQSFMLNQIRKMIGAVVCMCACDLPPSHIQETLLHKHVRCGIPMAPANGLFLSNLDFSGYNARLRKIQRDGGNGGNKDGIDLDELIDVGELEEERRRITAVVLRNEMVEDLMGKWMRSLRHVVRLAWKQELP